MDLAQITAASAAIARQVFTGQINVDPWDELNCYLRFTIGLYDIQHFLSTEDAKRSDDLLDELEELIERFECLSLNNQEYIRYLRETHLYTSQLKDEPVVERERWKDQQVSAATLSIPSMLYDETIRYYKWLAGSLSGIGEVVELGCWLGSSTSAVAEGLSANQAFVNHKIYSFDSFEWKSWMDDFFAGNHEIARPLAGDSFLPLFLDYCKRHKDLIEPRICYVAGEGEANTLPAPEWNGNPIELFIYDMGPNSPRLHKVWNTFAPSFISGKTLVVFNEHGNARADEIRRFTLENRRTLVPLHKPATSAKTFLFGNDYNSCRGRRNLTTDEPC
jgi:hypothetical protein